MNRMISERELVESSSRIHHAIIGDHVNRVAKPNDFDMPELEDFELNKCTFMLIQWSWHNWFKWIRIRNVMTD